MTGDAKDPLELVKSKGSREISYFPYLKGSWEDLQAAVALQTGGMRFIERSIKRQNGQLDHKGISRWLILMTTACGFQRIIGLRSGMKSLRTGREI